MDLTSAPVLVRTWTCGLLPVEVSTEAKTPPVDGFTVSVEATSLLPKVWIQAVQLVVTEELHAAASSPKIAPLPKSET